ncbi:hypothetical protein S616_22535, partial [Salmonella enterica subsp. enterica]|nr:hypothetical protein [Salmonella enterica subsp. enterica]
SVLTYNLWGLRYILAHEIKAGKTFKCARLFYYLTLVQYTKQSVLHPQFSLIKLFAQLLLGLHPGAGS